MAGPWTISRARRDGERGQDLRKILGRAGSRATPATLLVRLPVAAARRLGARGPARADGKNLAAGAGRPVKIWWAIPLIALMTATAVLLAWATVRLAEGGIAAGRAAAVVSGGPLVTPAPRLAGGLPRRVGTAPDPAERRIRNQLGRRFAAASDRLLATASRGDPGKPVTTIRPEGLYGQPGHLDPRTSRPSWVLYLGLQSSAALGQPIDTIGSVMLSLLGNHNRISSWPVPAGHRGGQANCTVTMLAGTQMSVCGWATGHIIGLVASPARETGVRELATLLIKMRQELQRG